MSVGVHEHGMFGFSVKNIQHIQLKADVVDQWDVSH